MAGPKDVILGQLQFGQMLLEKFTADLSDDEYFIPAVTGSNHACWILGHLAYAEDWASSLMNGSAQRIPETTQKLFKGGSTCEPNASKYPSRKEIDDLFRDTRAHTVAEIQIFDERRWDEANPDEESREFFPTLGDLMNLTGTHQFWHLGQLTDCRRKMNKKLVLGDS